MKADRDSSVNRRRKAAQLLRTKPTAWPLSSKVILALALALLPMGVLALIAAIDAYQELRDNQQQVVIGRLDTLRQTVEASLDQDFSMLQALLLTEPRGAGPSADCNRLLARAAQFDSQISAIVRLNATGRTVCASGPQSPVPVMLNTARSLPDGGARFIRRVLVDEQGPTRDLMLAVRDNGVMSSGDTVVARIPQESAARFINPRSVQPHEVVQLRHGSRVIATWGDASALPASRLSEETPSESSDDSWLVRTADLGTDKLHLALYAPAPRLTTNQALIIALPALMWLSALGIGWLAIDRLVVGPLIQMRRSVERYASGDATVRLGAHNYATQEMAHLGAAFDRMADQIDSHEEELRSALTTQKRLTREVHHRVKNNLQIVSSLLSLQSRDAGSPEVANAYATIQKRVNALALVHRWLYDDEAMRGVDLRSLANDLCAGLEQSIAAFEGVQISIASDVERIYVGQDTAVPLAFLITELVTAAARLSKEPTLAMRIAARTTDSKASLSIEAPVFRGADVFATGSSDPSARIVQGMARQMRSKLNHDPVKGSYTIEFPRAPAGAAQV